MVAPGPPPLRAAIELTFTITPAPFSIMPGATAWVMNHALFDVQVHDPVVEIFACTPPGARA